jgi:hypothetical protein
MAVICPSCVSEQPDWADTCLECGASLTFLRQHPRRVGFAIWLSMLAGLALLVSLLARLLDQFFAPRIPIFGWLEAAELGLGVLLSLLGARGWATLKDAVIQLVPSRRSR